VGQQTEAWRYIMSLTWMGDDRVPVKFRTQIRKMNMIRGYDLGARAQDNKHIAIKEQLRVDIDVQSINQTAGRLTVTGEPTIILRPATTGR